MNKLPAAAMDETGTTLSKPDAETATDTPSATPYGILGAGPMRRALMELSHNKAQQSMAMVLRSSKGLYELAAPLLYERFEINHRTENIFGMIYMHEHSADEVLLLFNKERIAKGYGQKDPESSEVRLPEYFVYSPVDELVDEPEAFEFFLSMRRLAGLLARVKDLRYQRSSEQSAYLFDTLAHDNELYGGNPLPICLLRPKVYICQEATYQWQSLRGVNISNDIERLRHLVFPSELYLRFKCHLEHKHKYHPQNDYDDDEQEKIRLQTDAFDRHLGALFYNRHIGSIIHLLSFDLNMIFVPGASLVIRLASCYESGTVSGWQHIRTLSRKSNYWPDSLDILLDRLKKTPWGDEKNFGDPQWLRERAAGWKGTGSVYRKVDSGHFRTPEGPFL